MKRIRVRIRKIIRKIKWKLNLLMIDLVSYAREKGEYEVSRYLAHHLRFFKK